MNAWLRAAGWLILSILPLALTGCCTCEDEPSAPAEIPIAEGTGQFGHTHHGIDYIEFTVTDMDASKRFYGDAFGWTFNDYGPDYAGIVGGHGEVGGFRLDTEITVGSPLVILYSQDLEKTVESVSDAGGTIVTEPFLFPGGRRFHFTDPSGNELAVWSEQ